MLRGLSRTPGSLPSPSARVRSSPVSYRVPSDGVDPLPSVFLFRAPVSTAGLRSRADRSLLATDRERSGCLRGCFGSSVLESFSVPAWGIEARQAWGFARERRVHGIPPKRLTKSGRGGARGATANGSRTN